VHLASALAYAQREHLDCLFSYDDDFLNLNGAITQRFPIKEPFQEQLALFSKITESPTAPPNSDPEFSQGDLLP
jgi:hypothetical protein